MPPGDLVPAGDAAQLQNWRAGQAGALRSRLGMTLESGNLPYYPIYRIFRAAQDRYAFVGGQVLYGADLAHYMFGGADGVTAGFASMSGAVWFSSVTAQRFMIGPAHQQTGMDPPETSPDVAAGAAGPLSGAFSYYVTFGNDYGHESNPSPVSAEVTASSQAVELTNIPISSDPQVTIRYVYRVGGGVLSPSRIATIAATGGYTDAVAIAQQQTLAKSLSFDNDRPPGCYGLIGPYFGRLVAFRSIAYPGRAWWSRTGLPWAWPGAADSFEGNWQDVGDVREAIYAASVRKRLLTYYKEKNIWRQEGDPDVSDPEQTAADVGIVGPHALASRGALDYFVGPEGVYEFNGDRESLISVKIAPIFRGEYTKIGDAIVAPLNRDYAWQCQLAQVNGRLYLSYPPGTSTEPDVTLVCDLDSGRWYTHKLAASFGRTGFTALYNEAGGAFLGGFRGPAGSLLYRLEQGTDDATNAIPLIWQSRFIDCGLPEHEKVFADVTVESSTRDDGDAYAAATLTVEALYDNGATVETLGTVSSTGRGRQVFQTGAFPDRKGRNIAARISGNTASVCRIYDVTVNYYAEPRKARSYDSGVTDAGSRNLKECQGVELDIEVSGSALVLLWNEYGGWSEARRKTVGATGRALVTIYEDPPQWDASAKQAIAREYRLLIQAVGAADWFKVYGARIKVAPAGVYVTGSPREDWTPAAIAL